MHTASDVLRAALVFPVLFLKWAWAPSERRIWSVWPPAELAKICQYAENTYFWQAQRPAGSADQRAAALSLRILQIPSDRFWKRLHADDLFAAGAHALPIRSDGETHFATIRRKMDCLAVLGQVTEAFWAATKARRPRVFAPSTILKRTLHPAQRDALQAGSLLPLRAPGAAGSGRILCAMPECLLQHRCAASRLVALALSQSILQRGGTEPGGCRAAALQGPIQAFGAVC